MFHLMVRLAYIVAGFYLFFRLRRLIPAGSAGPVSPGLARIIFYIFFALLLAAWPLTETLAHRSTGGSSVGLLTAGYMTMPYLLYLFLFTLLSDLFLGLLRLTRVIPSMIPSGAGRRFLLIFLLVAPLAVLAFGVWNYNTLRVSEYHVDLEKGVSPLPGVRVVLVSDFHLGEVTSKRFMKEFPERVNSLRPDLVLIPGDIMENDRGLDDAAFVAMFRRLQTRFGVWASPGNHEHHGGNGRGDFFERAGIRLLENELATIHGSLTLAGFPFDYRGRLPLAPLVARAPTNLPLIMLSHQPPEDEEILTLRPAFYVSGHTHAGQLFPINLINDLLYDTSWGLRQVGRSRVLVTSGIQGWGPPVRTWGYSEIVVIEIEFR